MVFPAERQSVLLLDPDQVVQQQVNHLLAPRFAVYGANTLDEASALITTKRPQFLIFEPALTVDRGVQFIQQVRQSPLMQHAVILCLSTRSAVADKVAAFQAGANDYVVKPVMRTFLYRLLLLKRIQETSGR